MLAEHSDRIGEEFWEGADLVMEVVSGNPRDGRRDLVTKRRQYALAGIAEYWIIDPHERLVTVLRRRGKSYVVHSRSGPGGRVTSALLKGFELDGDAVLAAARVR